MRGRSTRIQWKLVWRYAFTTLTVLTFVLNLVSLLNQSCLTTSSYPSFRGSSKGINWFLEDPALDQFDPDLAAYITKYHMEPPSSLEYPEGIQAVKEPSLQGNIIQAIFKGQRNGFFLEAGALDGASESNTLVLERDFGWDGVLIEGNSFILPKLRQAHRKAWVADVCLALTPYPQKIRFVHSLQGPMASQIDYNAESNNRSKLKPGNGWRGMTQPELPNGYISAGYVECFPVASILAALRVTRVDYMSLDIEGAELKVLRNIPFDEIDIKVISVEHWIVSGGIEALDRFFYSKNYIRVSKQGSDSFYVKGYELERYNIDAAIIVGSNTSSH